MLVGGGFSNNLTQYDDFDPGPLFDSAKMEPFSFTVDDFDVDWITEGRNIGMSRKFVTDVRYRTEPGAKEQRYDLKVNHPLSIGGTDVFLIGHGYAPEITIRDGDGKVVSTGPTVFLPMQRDLLSFGVVKAAFADPEIGLRASSTPPSSWSTATPQPQRRRRRSTLSMLVWTGDLGGSRTAPAVSVRPGQVEGDDGREGRQAVPDRPQPGQERAAARRTRLGHLRRGAQVEPRIQIQPHAVDLAGACSACAWRCSA